MATRDDNARKARQARTAFLMRVRGYGEPMHDLPDPANGHAPRDTPVRVRRELAGEEFGFLTPTVHRIGTGGEDNPKNWVHVKFKEPVVNSQKHVPFKPEELQMPDGSDYGAV